MKGEGKKVQGDEDGGQVLLTMAKVMFDVVSLGLEDVEGFILDFPPGTTAGNQFSYVV